MSISLPIRARDGRPDYFSRLLTRMRRPSSSCSFIDATAASACSCEPKVTKPKPRLRPVSLQAKGDRARSGRQCADRTARRRAFVPVLHDDGVGNLPELGERLCGDDQRAPVSGLLLVFLHVRCCGDWHTALHSGGQERYIPAAAHPCWCSSSSFL